MALAAVAWRIAWPDWGGVADDIGCSLALTMDLSDATAIAGAGPPMRLWSYPIEFLAAAFVQQPLKLDMRSH